MEESIAAWLYVNGIDPMFFAELVKGVAIVASIALGVYLLYIAYDFGKYCEHINQLERHQELKKSKREVKSNI